MKLILIVDDSELSRKANFRLVSMLIHQISAEVSRDFPYGIWQAESGEDAVTMMREQEGKKDDLFLLTDGEMPPGMDGAALIGEARLIHGERLRRAVLLTGNPRFFAAFVEELDAVLIDKTDAFLRPQLRELLRTFLLG